MTLIHVHLRGGGVEIINADDIRRIDDNGTIELHRNTKLVPRHHEEGRHWGGPEIRTLETVQDVMDKVVRAKFGDLVSVYPVVQEIRDKMGY